MGKGTANMACKGKNQTKPMSYPSMTDRCISITNNNSYSDNNRVCKKM